MTPPGTPLALSCAARPPWPMAFDLPSKLPESLMPPPFAKAGFWTPLDFSARVAVTLMSPLTWPPRAYPRMVGRGGEGAKLKSETYCTGMLEAYCEVHEHHTEGGRCCVGDDGARNRASERKRGRLRYRRYDFQDSNRGRRERALDANGRLRLRD